MGFHAASTLSPDKLPSAVVQHKVTGLTLRQSGDEDLAFLCQLFRSSRFAELALLPVGEEALEGLIQMQFKAQQEHYASRYPAAQDWIIEVDGAPVGRLYLEKGTREHLLIDIALLSQHQGNGYGAQLIGDLQAEAAAAGKPLRLRVAENNPAARLYQRLGFKAVDREGVHRLLEWKAEH